MKVKVKRNDKKGNEMPTTTRIKPENSIKDEMNLKEKQAKPEERQGKKILPRKKKKCGTLI